MIRIKAHLKYLNRVNVNKKTRKGCLRLDMNENVNGLPKNFVKNVFSQIGSEYLAAYPEYKALEEKIARHNKLKPENICLSNGSDAAIKYIFDAYISRGDRVLITDPTFGMYPVYCRMFNAEAVTVEYNSSLEFPKKDFLKAISPKIKMAVIVNPNNPAGSILADNDLIEIIKKLADNDIIVLVDEAYFYFYPHTVIGEIKNYSNLIVLRTFSKLCGIASARIGYAAACPKIIESLKKVKPSYDVNGLAVLFAEKILDSPRIIKSLIKQVYEGKKYLVNRLSENGIPHKDSFANFVLIKCCKRSAEITGRLAKNNILIHGGFAQEFLKDYIRVTIGDKNTMRIFWESFIKIWERA